MCQLTKTLRLYGEIRNRLSRSASAETVGKVAVDRSSFRCWFNPASVSALIYSNACLLGRVYVTTTFLDRLLGWFRFDLHHPGSRYWSKPSTERTGKSDAVSDHCGVLLMPCTAVHTLAMPCCIDLVFFDHDHRVCKLVYGLRPWRCCVCLHARGVIELMPGSLAQNKLAVGDVVTVNQSDKRVWPSQAGGNTAE